MRGILFDSVVDNLGKGLDALSRRHQVLANNLANADTPGFKRSEVDFAVNLADALEAASKPQLVTTSSGHLSGDRGGLDPREFRISERRVEETSGRPDGNNVDVEVEMARLAENTIMYEAVARQVADRLALLRTAISEGRR